MELYPAFHISPKLLEAAQRAEELARPQFAEIESIQRYNQQKMLAAFSKAGVSESHFVGSTGYGYGDRGRDVLDQVYAYAFGAEDALVRHNFVSGTHTLTVALFGMLRPGDKMLCVTGTPYDTIQGVIGMEGREEPGSLKEFGIHYEELPLCPDGTPDLEAMERRRCDLVIAPYTEVLGQLRQKRGFLDQDMILSQRQFLDRLSAHPNSFFYAVLWNKLYRREIIMAHDIRCDEEFTWSEDMLFNLSYIRYADSFYAIRTPLYYYSRRRKHSLSASVNPAQVVTTKASLFKYYKDLYVQLGLYDQYKLQIYSYLVATAKDLD